MAIEARRERLADWAGAAFWATCAGFLAWRVLALLYADLNPDEPVFIVQAWDVARGFKLYGPNPGQHMPAIIMLAHPLAALGLVRDPAPYRMLLLLAQTLAGLALAASPAFHGQRWRGWVAGGLYLGLVAAWAPSLQGFTFTPYPFAGAALVLSVAALALPLAQGLAPSPAWSALGGAAVAAWLSTSPALGIPALFFLAACALAPSLGRRAWRWAAMGGLAVAVSQLLWMWRYASFLGWWRQAIVFNATIYPALNREAGPEGLWGAALRGVLGDLWIPGLPMLAALGFPLALLAARPPRPSARHRWMLALLAAFFVSLHSRMYLWKGLPYWCVAWAGLAAAIPLLARNRVWGMALALTLAVPLALGTARTLSHEGSAESRAFWHHGDALAMELAFAQLRAALPPDSTLLALPDVSRYHMITGMPNVGGMQGYGPIPYLMERRWPDHLSPTLCDQIALKTPALIYDFRGSSMYHVPMADCLPDCLEPLERSRFVPIKGWRHWWLRKDLVGALPRPLPALP